MPAAALALSLQAALAPVDQALHGAVQAYYAVRQADHQDGLELARRRVMARLAAAQVRGDILADLTRLRAVFVGCFPYREWPYAGRWVRLAGAGGGLVRVPDATAPVTGWPLVVVLCEREGRAARLAAARRLIGAPDALPAVVAVATPADLGDLLATPASDYGELRAWVESACRGLGLMLPDGPLAGLRLAAQHVGEHLRQARRAEPSARGVFALLGLAQRRIAVDRDRWVLLCEPEMTAIGLTAASLAPDRFAAVVVDGIAELPSPAALDNLSMVQVAMTGDVGSQVESRLREAVPSLHGPWSVDRARRFWVPARRDPWPRRVRMVSRQPVGLDAYWLRVDAADVFASRDRAATVEVTADRAGNRLTLRSENVRRVTLLLNDDLVDLDLPFTIDVNGFALRTARARSRATLLDTVADRFDGGFLFTTVLSIDVPLAGGG